jgi:hypothetical protein
MLIGDMHYYCAAHRCLESIECQFTKDDVNCINKYIMFVTNLHGMMALDIREQLLTKLVAPTTLVKVSAQHPWQPWSRAQQ